MDLIERIHLVYGIHGTFHMICVITVQAMNESLQQLRPANNSP